MEVSELIELYKHPRHWGGIDHPTLTASDENPLCGESLRVDIQLHGDIIADLSFVGDGCTIAVASASLLGDHLIGQPLTIVATMTDDDALKLTDPPSHRRSCALLPWHVIKHAVDGYEEKS